MSSTHSLAPASGRFEGGEHCFPLRVYYEDTDAGGVVYHSNYLCYMERARTDMLQLLGIRQREALDSGLGAYAIADLHIRYRLPARLEDALIVRSRVLKLSPARCVISQSIWRDDAELTQASVTVAFIDANGRARRQPADWMARFSSLVPKETNPS